MESGEKEGRRCLTLWSENMFLELDYPLGTSGNHHNYPKAAINAMQYFQKKSEGERPPAVLVQTSRTVTRKL